MSSVVYVSPAQHLGSHKVHLLSTAVVTHFLNPFILRGHSILGPHGQEGIIGQAAGEF